MIISSVVRDFKQYVLLNLQSKIPACRVQYEGVQTPRIERSQIQFLVVSYEAYLVHLGL